MKKSIVFSKQVAPHLLRAYFPSMLNSYLVVSKQQAPHPSTEFRAEKHANTIYCRPFSESQLTAFKLVDIWIQKQNRPVVLDSGCGTGDSTYFLSKRFPDFSIVGVDRSEHRLEKARAKFAPGDDKNFFFVRARLEDFWRLVKKAKWNVGHHFIFYPNPCPKPEHYSQRWHGHPVFPDLLQLSDRLEIRSNWMLYLQEFSIAVNVLTGQKETPQLIENPEGVSAFERKYKESENPCYALCYRDLATKFTRRAG